MQAHVDTQADPAAPEARATFPSLDTLNVEALMWAWDTGHYLPGTHARVLEELAHYVDRRRGDYWVWPSQDTLAVNLDMARGTVCRIIGDLRTVGAISVSTRDDIEGHHNRYELMIGDPSLRERLCTKGERRSIVMVLSDENEALRTRVQELEALVNGGEAEAIAPTAVTIMASNGQTSSMMTGGSSSSSNTELIIDSKNNDYYDDDTNIIPDDVCLSDAQVKRADVTDWVNEMWDFIKRSEENRGGWPRMDQAINWYVTNYDTAPTGKSSFVDQVEVWELQLRKEAAPESGHHVDGRQADTPVHYRGEPNPATRQIWRLVLDELQGQLPRSAFQTWLKHTEGVVHDDDLFVVEAPTSFAVQWLERRMYNAIQKTVEKVTGQPLEVRFQVQQEEGR